MKHHTQIQVDLFAYEHNIQTIKKHLPKNTLYCAVLKGDAYGHGLKKLAPIVCQSGADCIAIVDNWEAACVRQLGVKCPILRLRPALNDEIHEAITWEVQELCGSLEGAMELSRVGVASNSVIPVHLKIDVGMGRMGFTYEKVDELVRQLFEDVMTLSGIEVVGLMCHFSCADESDLSLTNEQLKRFNQIISKLRPHLPQHVLIHYANSAATLRLLEPGSMVRVGLAGYGLKVGNADSFHDQLLPVMSWKSRIVQLRRMKKGASIGYGLTYHCPRDSFIATLPFGYADGFSRALSNNADVLIRGNRCPIVGRVSMNLVNVDVTHLNDVNVGDEVVMIGKQGDEMILLDELATRAQMLNYELACLIGKCNQL